MEFEKINIWEDGKRVLVAPLDWGLGHATRCIPIIYALLAKGAQVIIAAEGPIKNLLKKEFPDVVFTELKGYKIRYSSKGYWLPLRLLIQFPKLLRSIYREQQWLKKIIKAYKIDAVISDNRLGMFSTAVPSVYITHQLKIKTGHRFTEGLAQRIHYFFINKYSSCWVPDNGSTNNLAGELSHPGKLPAIPVQYIGPLSRFNKITIEKKNDLLIILSGPEPQRTIFEEILLKQLNTFTGTVVLVRGLPSTTEKKNINADSKLTVFNHLSSAELNSVIGQSQLVISRSGYTTIMDLIKLRQKAILVPTPGQTEQEYLAAYLMEKKIFFSSTQADFSLQEALEKAIGFPFVQIFIEQEKYVEVVNKFTATLK